MTISSEATSRRLRTALFLRASGLPVATVNKVREGSPHVVDRILAGDVHMLINTTEGRQAIIDSYSLRRAALERNLPIYTTARAAAMLVASLEADRLGRSDVLSLQERLAFEGAQA